jgi:hypothetical protein
LLVAEELARRGRAAGGKRVMVDEVEVERIVKRLVGRFGRHWRADVRAEGGAARLTKEVVDHLSAFELVRRSEATIAILPAIARFASRRMRSHGREAE